MKRHFCPPIETGLPIVTIDYVVNGKYSHRVSFFHVKNKRLVLTSPGKYIWYNFLFDKGFKNLMLLK